MEKVTCPRSASSRLAAAPIGFARIKRDGRSQVDSPGLAVGMEFPGSLRAVCQNSIGLSFSKAQTANGNPSRNSAVKNVSKSEFLFQRDQRDILKRPFTRCGRQ